MDTSTNNVGTNQASVQVGPQVDSFSHVGALETNVDPNANSDFRFAWCGVHDGFEVSRRLEGATIVTLQQIKSVKKQRTSLCFRRKR